MSLQHFFLNKQVLSKEIEKYYDQPFALDLSKDDLHHFKVLRLNAGEHIGVIDAAGVFYECEIVEVSNDVKVKNSLKENVRKKQDCPKITLYAGITKSNKLDEVVRASTEIGLDKFSSVIFERSVVKLDAKKASSKLERWQKIAKSAAMQSGQMRVPNVELKNNVNEMCQDLKNYDTVICFWEEADKNLDTQSLSDLSAKLNKDSSLAIIIGPEGGISQQEINLIKSSNKNTVVVGMGDSILRAETACIFAVSVLRFTLAC